MNAMRKSHRGFSLPELMVAILLGTIVTAAVIGMYLTTSKNFRQDEAYALMQENGRYALRALSEDLAMADFWGTLTANFTLDGTVTAPAVSGTKCVAGAPAATFAASTGLGLYLGDTALIYNNANNAPKFQIADCPVLYDNQRTNTNILVIKRTLGAPETTFTTGVMRLRTNGTNATFVNDNTAPGAGFNDWRYVPRIYFIRNCYEADETTNACEDALPSLCRLDLVNVGGAPEMGGILPDTGAEKEDFANCIAEGIEHVHIMFGIDTDGDGVANRYNSSPTFLPAASAEMEGTVSARIYILARTTDADPTYTDAKSYVLGDLNVAAANDGFYRRVFSTTVMIRNSVNLNLLNN